MIDPQAQALLDLMISAGAPPMNELPVDEARAAYRDRRHVTQPDPPEVGAVSDFTIEHVPVRGYRPAGVDAEEPLPALVYFHGGGWTIGDLETHDTLCRSLCGEAGCAVFSVDYRMGPEHRFPAAVDDAWLVTRSLAASAGDQRIDPQRIAVGGDSAGGNLAAVVALMARDKAGPPLCFQLLIYPATDQTASYESHRRNGEGYLLTADLMRWFREQYHNSEAEFTDWRASPLFATSHSELPPALVLTAGFDPLVDEGKAYATRLADAGVAVRSLCFDGQIHGFITMGRMIDQSNEAVSVCAEALANAFASKPAAG